jgi:anti-anti-sigma regulatory factor
MDVPRRATGNESYQLAKLASEAEREVEPVVLDLQETEVVGPFGVAVLASILAVRHKEGRQTTITMPREELARHFLEEVAFHRFARQEETVWLPSNSVSSTRWTRCTPKRSWSC